MTLHESGHGFTHLGWVDNNLDAVGLEAGNLRLGISLTSTDDGSGVTHSSSWWRCLTSDKTHDWEVSLIVSREPLSSLLLGLSSDLTDHDDTFGLWVDNELLKHINEVGSVEWVTTDTNDG